MNDIIAKAIAASRERQRSRCKAGHSPFKQEYLMREALAAAVEALKYTAESWEGKHLDKSDYATARDALTRIAAILAGEGK